jgi:hypothetical protein
MDIEGEDLPHHLGFLFVKLVGDGKIVSAWRVVETRA